MCPDGGQEAGYRLWGRVENVLPHSVYVWT